MAGLNCDFLFSYNNRRDYVGQLNFRNVTTLQVQRIFDASCTTDPPTACGVPAIATGAYTGIIVNGVNFGSGRVLSFSNPTSTDITENGRHLWKQTVNVEVYESGDNSNLGGVISGVGPGYEATLQSFEEQFSFDITSDGDYQYSHSANIKCADGITGISGYLTAQQIASGLLSSTPPFGYIDSIHSGFYTLAGGRRTYSETINIFDGSVTFEEKFIIQSRDFLKHNVGFENGYMNVSESVTIRHSGVSTISGALTNNEFDINTRYTNAFSGAYARCNNVYTTYASILGDDPYANSLSTQPVQFTKVFDERSQELTYTVLYSNNPNLSTSGYLIEREQLISESNLGVIQASENATLTAYNFKTGSLQSFLISNLNGELSGMQVRMTPYYPSINNLKKETETKTISALGKKASYSIIYSSDTSLINDGTFLSQTFSIQDKLPIRMHTPYLIIGRGRPLMHAPEQTEMGAVSCIYSTVLTRPTGYNPNSPIRPDAALSQLFSNALNKALLTASIKSPTDVFATKVAYLYDSNFNAEVTVELQYLFPRVTII